VAHKTAAEGEPVFAAAALGRENKEGDRRDSNPRPSRLIYEMVGKPPSGECLKSPTADPSILTSRYCSPEVGREEARKRSA
jgi:hypothetical protein